MYFPLFVDISEKKILVAGAGKIAARRVETLLPFAGSITVVAPEICESIEKWEREGKICCERRAFAESDLEGADIVLAATDREEINTWIWEACKRKGIPVNTADKKERCDFYFPSIVKKDNLVIGINSSGTQPEKVREMRKKIEKL